MQYSSNNVLIENIVMTIEPRGREGFPETKLHFTHAKQVDLAECRYCVII